MGMLMVFNFVWVGMLFVVWSCLYGSDDVLCDVGVCVVDDIDDVFVFCCIVILMFVNDVVIDVVFVCGMFVFVVWVGMYMIVNMGMNVLDYFCVFVDEIVVVVGCYVEVFVLGLCKLVEVG